MAQLNKPLSRQRRWQIKQRSQGHCEKCGKPSSWTRVHCGPCRKQDTVSATARQQRLIAAGLCKACGAVRATNGLLCNRCYLNHKAANRRYRRAKR